MTPDNLTALKDDMIAFIEGHGMRHFPALIPEDMPRVWWDDDGPAGMTAKHFQVAKESWKDFVEMAKTAGAPMVLIGDDAIDKGMLEVLEAELVDVSGTHETQGEEMQQLDRLSMQVGKLGHIELAFAHQGVLFVHETATDWYKEYRELVETIEGEELFEDGLDALGEDPE